MDFLELLDVAIESEEESYKSIDKWSVEVGCSNSQVMLMVCSELANKEKLISSMKAYRKEILDGTLTHPVAGQQWVNKKNQKTYTVQGIGRHSEYLENTVSYMDDKGGLWFRPLYLFIEKFTHTPKEEEQ